MSFRSITLYVAVFVSLMGTVVAEEAATVGSLIKQGFTIVGATSNPVVGGAGLFLQKQDQVFMCFVAETPRSPAVTTRYCKAVQ